jgi:hypothetical protein
LRALRIISGIRRVEENGVGEREKLYGHNEDFHNLYS